MTDQTRHVTLCIGYADHSGHESWDYHISADLAARMLDRVNNLPEDGPRRVVLVVSGAGVFARGECAVDEAAARSLGALMVSESIRDQS